MEHKKYTLVVGASTNPARYSYLAIQSLRKHGHNVLALGLREGEVADVKIAKERPEIPVDTVTLYIGPRNQEPYKNYIEELKPRRVIFNPGTENPLFQDQLLRAGIEVIEACTLVMLSTNQY